MNNINDAALAKIFKQFSELLEDRFSKQVYTTEDSIRYTFFYCLTRYGGIQSSEIIIEYPHPRIPKAQIDTYIPSANERHGMAFEFKFDRQIPSKKNLPKPQKAGNVFSDIFRLALIEPNNENIQRYFIYVTDREMAIYFQNPSNQLDDFFHLEKGKILKLDRVYIEKHADTFVKSAGKHIVDCEVMGYLKAKCAQEIWLRIYEIKPSIQVMEP